MSWMCPQCKNYNDDSLTRCFCGADFHISFFENKDKFQEKSTEELLVLRNSMINEGQSIYNPTDTLAVIASILAERSALDSKSRVALCDACKVVGEGLTYNFYYGNFIGIENAHMTLSYQYVYTQKYAIKGEGSAFICNKCVTKYRRRYIFPFLLAVAGATTAGIIVLPLLSRAVGLEQLAYLLLTLVLVVVGSATFLTLFDYYTEAGSYVAVIACRTTYINKGSPILFVPHEYNKLRK